MKRAGDEVVAPALSKRARKPPSSYAAERAKADAAIKAERAARRKATQSARRQAYLKAQEEKARRTAAINAERTRLREEKKKAQAAKRAAEQAKREAEKRARREAVERERAEKKKRKFDAALKRKLEAEAKEVERKRKMMAAEAAREAANAERERRREAEKVREKEREARRVEAERIRALAAKEQQKWDRYKITYKMLFPMEDSILDGEEEPPEKLPPRPAPRGRLVGGCRTAAERAALLQIYDICFHFGKKFDLDPCFTLNDLHSALGFTSSEVPLVTSVFVAGQGGRSGSRATDEPSRPSQTSYLRRGIRRRNVPAVGLPRLHPRRQELPPRPPPLAWRLPPRHRLHRLGRHHPLRTPCSEHSRLPPTSSL